MNISYPMTKEEFDEKHKTKVQAKRLAIYACPLLKDRKFVVSSHWYRNGKAHIVLAVEPLEVTADA